jgi:hypothetical protein
MTSFGRRFRLTADRLLRRVLEDRAFDDILSVYPLAHTPTFAEQFSFPNFGHSFMLRRSLNSREQRQGTLSPASAERKASYGLFGVVS